MSAKINRQVILKSRPKGIPGAENFAIVEAPVPAPEIHSPSFKGNKVGLGLCRDRSRFQCGRLRMVNDFTVSVRDSATADIQVRSTGSFLCRIPL